ncbi:bactericidal permeability-increasing protein-like [Anabas testudineus]|uniref:bactericidal permeability-increasing protein-like n=1 Tax=Anabas testudineus TaxID=64144 RepID=UPI000E4564C7|nr:bactericidal permeability-increasing protein-like [Anabas testudineus]
MLPSVVILLILLSCTCGENPAIQFLLTNRGLYYGKHQATDWIQQNLEHATLPDISGEVDIGLLGSIDYTLTDITITKCDLPEPSVEFYPKITGFKTSISGLSIALTGGWSIHCSIIRESGSFDMAVFNLNVISAVELGKDPGGHLSVSSISCDAQVGDVDVQFHGEVSWILHLFVQHFKGRISGEIQKRICPSVEEIFVKLESHLQAMNVSFDVNQVLSLDLHLTSLPVVDATSLNLGLKGEFYNIRTHSEPPFKLKSFTLPEQQGYMVSVGLSEFTLNSASYGYYSAGLLQADINDSMILQHLHMHLNTSVVGLLIPQLLSMFPGLPMSLKVYARQVPVFSFQHDVVKLGLHGAVKAFAIQPNGTQIPLFTLNVDSDLSGKIYVSDGKLKGSVKMDKFTLKLAASEVGTFKTDTLENLTRCGIQTIVFPKVNEKLDKGFVLPRIKQAQLVNSVLKVEQGFMAMSSDVEVFPSDKGLK